MNNGRILVIAENLPYPSFAGVDLRNWQNVNSLKAVGTVGVFGLCCEDPRLKEPLPLADLAFYRCSRDPRLVYPPRDVELPRHKWLLQPLAHSRDFFNTVVACELQELIETFCPEIVLVEGLWLHRCLDLLRAYRCRTVLDCHNVEAALSQELGGIDSGNDLRTRIKTEILPERVRKIEEKAIRQVHQVWVCSKQDADRLRLLYQPSVPVQLVPNGVDVNYYCDPTCVPQFSQSSGPSIIFPGMYAYGPTRSAAAFLVKELFPRIVDVFADSRLMLPGNWPTDFMLAAARQDPRIIVTGPVPDMRPYFKSASVMVAPIFQGGGTRLKLLEAFAAGVPVISTPKGAEGLDVENGRHLLLAEDTCEFVNSLKLLWQNEALAAHLIRNAAKLVREKYSWTVISRQVVSAIREIELLS